MADDINKKITIDVEISTDGQQQLNQYKVAFDSLRNSISNLSNPLTNLSSNISSFDKDVSRLTASIDKLNDQNKELNSGGAKVKSVITDLLGSFGAWDGIVKLFTKSVEGLEAAWSGGLTLLTTFLPVIIDWVGSLLKADDTLSALNKTLKDNKIIMDAVNQTRKKGTDDAQQELVHLKMLYTAAQDGNISLVNRERILAELQSRYPAYFGNLTAEAIRIGKAAKNYDDLTKAIMATARAKAAEELITKNQVRQLGNDDRLQKLAADRKAYQDQLTKAQSDLEEYDKKPVMGAMTEYDSMGAKLSAEIKSIQNEINVADQSISHLNTDSGLLTSQNERLAKNFIYDAEENQEQVLGIAANTDEKVTNLNKSSQQKQTAFVDEANNIRQESLTRQLQATYESFGKETLAENTHYQDELKKLTEFLTNKQITRKQFTDARNQLTKEHHAILEALANKYNEQDKERTQQALNELAELRIKNMKDSAEKEKAEALQQQAEKLQELDKTDADIISRQRKLQAEMKTASPDELPALKKQLADEETAWWLSYAKRLEIKKQTTSAIKAIDDKETDDAARKKHEQLLKDDKRAVDNTDDPEATLEAEKKEINDKYRFELDEAKSNAAETGQIKKNLNNDLASLDKAYRKQKKESDKKAREDLKNEELKDAEELAGQAFSMISQSIKQSSDAKITSMERDKEAELNNSSLTSAQKLAIEQKFKQQEAQVKAKAFKQEQEASIAQAVINGALAITKATAQSGVLSPFVVPVIIAETAVEIAKIAAQKPPAYASGGLHYSSDGRGGVLPGYSKTDNTNAWLRSGEGVVVSEAMRIPWARNLVSAINVGFGGRDFSIANPGRGYAVGGIFTDGGDANRYYNQPVHDQKNLANSIAYQMINNFPPVYVDVKDINNQQNILAQTINRVNL